MKLYSLQECSEIVANSISDKIGGSKSSFFSSRYNYALSLIEKRKNMYSILTGKRIHKAVYPRYPNLKDHIFVSKVLFVITFHPDGFEVYKMIMDMEPSSNVSVLVDEMISDLYKNQDKINLLGYLSLNPSLNIFSNLGMKYGIHRSSLFTTGKVIDIYGERGSGKTSLAYWSVYSSLKVFGIDDHTLKKLIVSLYTNDLDRYFEILKEATELAMKGEIVPFIIFDDAGVTLSKYDLWLAVASIDKVKKVVELSKLEQISREGIGVVIRISNPKVLSKPFQIIPGITVEGMFVDAVNRYTIWFSYEKNVERRSVIYDVFSTIHPLIKTPDDVLRYWNNLKFSVRARVSSEIEKNRV